MNDNGELEVTAYEIDGKDYVISKIVDYEGSNYCYLVNIEDGHDVFVKKYVNGELEPVESKEIAFNVLLKIGSQEES